MGEATRDPKMCRRKELEMMKKGSVRLDTGGGFSEGKIKDNSAPSALGCCLHIIFRGALLEAGSAPKWGFERGAALFFGGRSLPAMSRNPP